MKCRKCGSEQVNVQVVSETTLKTRRKTWLYWLTIGWFIEPLLWIFLTLPKLIYELFIPKRVKLKTKTRKIAVCQVCGESWDVKASL
ncbi:MAG TPA: hypothetical protein PKK82_08180 [Anaerolineaceae bacterium]|nr:hypothetical protein [Chloroflexota bacterium]HNY84823.1 hypothetical protein [Anaerolineaceae bacterium]